MKLSMEISKAGRKAYTLPASDIGAQYIEPLPEEYIRKDSPRLPELSELDVVRHFVNLSSLNYNIDRNFYPLGSCTMKYNPKINEYTSRLEGFAGLHPLQCEDTVQGAMEMLYDLENMLAEISGMDAVSLQPVAGAHSELTAMFIVRKFFSSRGGSASGRDKKGEQRTKILIPDSAHGTNPASAILAKFTTVTLKSNEKGLIDLNNLAEALTPDVACLMLTVPNTLGLFESQIAEIAEIVHKNGSLLYLDGANLNAFVGIAKAGDMGFDIIHFNLHKTFGTPHGTGGPGGGGIGVQKELAPFLPIPRIVKNEDTACPASQIITAFSRRLSGCGGKSAPTKFEFSYNFPDSIGKVHSFYGNFGVCVKAYTYIRMLGANGLKRVAENAIINANYLMAELRKYYKLPYEGPCMHEFVLSGDEQVKAGVKTLDIAKRLLDYGIHPPTIYFPLIVHEALMIEPPETESVDTLNEFRDALIKIAEESSTQPDILKSAPHNTPVGRLNEAEAARILDVNFYKRKSR